uniref:Uncharacterized protein n=1 Tax=Helianthus annuus TaxID=4232 RepID=A0A251TWU0_HELAN
MQVLCIYLFSSFIPATCIYSRNACLNTIFTDMRTSWRIGIGTVPVQNLNNTSQREYRYGIETREMGEHEID